MPSCENYPYLSQRLVFTILFMTKTLGILIVFTMKNLPYVTKNLLNVFSLVNVEYKSIFEKCYATNQEEQKLIYYVFVEHVFKNI